MNNNVIKGNTNKLASLEYVFIVLLMAIYLLPSVSIGSTVFLGVLLMYSAYIFFFDRKSSQTVVAVLLLVVLLALVYAFLTNANSIAQTVSNRTLKRFISKMYQYYTLYFPAVLFVHVKMKASSNRKKHLWLFRLS